MSIKRVRCMKLSQSAEVCDLPLCYCLLQLINQRQWYEKPGSTDRFSDGSSPCSLKVPALEERAAADCLHISDVLNARVRKVGRGLMERFRLMPVYPEFRGS